ncbi:probable G-protein coupled receptor 19 [Dendronephthya gigantea]|uniref:probable G-protein coupled receptor 19 n=1 Tax=Dendronephthya gigantea TaxID=151771 RepID=UPI00106B14CC|nr:probable G-protein coupled receptor 19 [Dendronephthya gigantea]
MSNNIDTPWKVAYLIVILVTTIIGNILVIMVVYRSRRNQWTTNHFVISLAIVNLLAPTAYLFITLYSAFHKEWFLGNIGCKINTFLVHFNALTSVGILCCMSFDRYYLTAYPLTFKLSKTQTKKVIAAVWILAISIACPMAFFYKMHSTDCQPEFSEQWTAYICCFCILFLLPHFTTYATYLKVYHCIRTRNNQIVSRFSQKVPRTKIKVTKLLMAQVIVYTVLWLPYIAYQLIISLTDDRTSVLAIPYLAYASSAASPMIYSIFSADFRRGCKLIFMKYDASIAYRLPVQIDRKNKVDVVVSEHRNYRAPGASEKGNSNLVPRRETEFPPSTGLTFFEQPRIAWSDV